MKKIISTCLWALLAFSSIPFFFTGSPKNGSVEFIQYTPNPTQYPDYVYLSEDDRYRVSTVLEGGYYAINNASGNVLMDNFVLAEDFSDCKLGDIFKKGDSHSGHVFDSQSMLFSKNQGVYTFVDLDSTRIEFSIPFTDEVVFIRNSTYELNFHSNKVIVDEADVSLNDTFDSYDVTVHIPNSDGRIVEGTSVDAKISTHVKRDGIFVRSNYIVTVYDGSEFLNFVQKLYNFHGDYYYKYIPVTVIKDYGTYSLVEGDLKNENNIISFVS